MKVTEITYHISDKTNPARVTYTPHYGEYKAVVKINGDEWKWTVKESPSQAHAIRLVKDSLNFIKSITK